MPAPRKYPSELRERAVRLVGEAREQEPELSLNGAVLRIGPRVGVNKDTLRGWCKQAVDPGPPRATRRSSSCYARRSRSSNAPTRSCWRRRVSLRGSSTRDCRGDAFHRRAPRSQDGGVALGGRADLRGADEARLWDRPIDVLRREDSSVLAAVGA